MTETAQKPARVRRSPAQRAQEALEAAHTAEQKAAAAVERLRTELDNAVREHERAKSFTAYASSHPDLPKTEASDDSKPEATDG